MKYPVGFICYQRGIGSKPAQKQSQRSGSDRCPKPIGSSSFFIKAVRTAIILIAVLLVLISFLGGRRGLYPRYGKIIGIEYDYDCYIIEDLAGFIWVYEGIEDLSIGDDIAMLMWDRMSPDSIYDDVILEIR